MPLILAPYTLGTQLPAAPVTPKGGGWNRRRRQLHWMGLLVLLLLVLP